MINPVTVVKLIKDGQHLLATVNQDGSLALVLAAVDAIQHEFADTEVQKALKEISDVAKGHFEVKELIEAADALADLAPHLLKLTPLMAAFTAIQSEISKPEVVAVLKEIKSMLPQKKV